MKKSMKKVLSGISAAALALGSVASCVAFAEDEATEVATLDALKEAVQSGKTNIVVTGTITVNEAIDLTGVTLTAAATAGTWTNGCVIKMTDGGKITGGSLNGNGRDLYVVNVDSGTAELDGVTVDNQPLTNDGYPTTVTAHSTIRNNGNLTLTSCTVKSGEPAAVKNEEDTTLNVDGGTITGETIGITNFGTTTLDGGATVTSKSGSTAIYALTYDGFDSTTTVNNATVDGTILYGGYGTAANGGKATKTPSVVIGEDAVLVNSGFEVASNETMVKLPVDETGNMKAPSLEIDENADVQLASTEDLDPVLVDALKNVKNITDSEGKPLEVNDDGEVVAVQFDVTLPVSFDNGAVTADVAKAAAGAKVTLTVTPDTGYALGRLTLSALVNGETTGVETTEEGDGTYTFTMPAGHVIVIATFAREYAISTLSVTGIRSVQLSTNKAIAGTEITVTIEPATGYKLDKITYKVGDGEPVDVEGGKFTMPEGDVKVIPVVSELAADKYAVTVNPAKNGTVTALPNEAEEGDEITVTATPAEGYELEEIVVMNGTEKVTVTNGKFTMPAGNVTVSATFKEVKTEEDNKKPGDDDKKPGDDKPTTPGDDDNKPDDDKPTTPGDDDKKPGDDKPTTPGDDDNKPDDDKPTTPGDDDNKPVDPGATEGNGNGAGDGEGENHGTGIALAAAPVLLAASAVAAVAIKKKTK